MEACGGIGEPACTTGEPCECGLLAAVDNTCQDTGVGCNDASGVSADAPIGAQVRYSQLCLHLVHHFPSTPDQADSLLLNAVQNTLNVSDA